VTGAGNAVLYEGRLIGDDLHHAKIGSASVPALHEIRPLLRPRSNSQPFVSLPSTLSISSALGSIL